MTNYRIGDLARTTGTKVETIRWYEKQGLLPRPTRTAGNYRTYSKQELVRLSFIRRARDLGFSLDQVRALLELAENRESDCASVDCLVAEHLAEIDRKVADLNALRGELSALLSSCRGGKVADCCIIDALAPSRGVMGSRRST